MYERPIKADLDDIDVTNPYIKNKDVPAFSGEERVF